MHQNLKSMRYLLFGFGLLWAGHSLSVKAEENVSPLRAEYLGFSAAFPTTQASTPAPLAWNDKDTLQSATAIVTVDSSGCVGAVSPWAPGDSLLVSESAPFIAALNFAAGMKNGVRVESKLALRVKRLPKTYYPHVDVPVDSLGTVVERTLYERTLQLNEIELPQVEEFPSLFCDLKATDSIDKPPLVVLDVLIDSSGGIQDIRQVFSDYPTFELQVESAVLWGKYRPARVAGRPVASHLLLAVSFLPSVGYPTKVWSPKMPDSTNLQARFVVQYGIEGSLPIRPPLLRNLFTREFSGTVPLPQYRAEIAVHVAIDSVGNAQAMRIYPADATLFGLIQRMVGRARFYPAVLPNGCAVPFTGILRINPQDERRIILTQSWLQ